MQAFEHKNFDFNRKFFKIRANSDEFGQNRGGNTTP